jgi:hypothetical protein
MYNDSAYGLLLQDRARLDAARENTARTARSAITYTTTGIGELFTGVYLDLKTRFVEEPVFTSGMVLDHSTPLVSGHYPRAHTGVTEWHRDSSDFYVGAFLFFCVDTTGPGSLLGTEPNYVIHHNLVFEGKAIKDLPTHLLDMVIGTVADDGKG